MVSASFKVGVGLRDANAADNKQRYLQFSPFYYFSKCGAIPDKMILGTQYTSVCCVAYAEGNCRLT